LKSRKTGLREYDKMLTDKQIDSWRKVLVTIVGVRALTMPIEEVQKFRDWMQEYANKYDANLKIEVEKMEKTIL